MTLRIIAFVLALLLANAPAFAAVTYDAVSSSSCQGCSGDSWSHTTSGANTFMLCGGGIQDFAGGTTIDAFHYNGVGNPLTFKDTQDASAEFISLVYKRTAPTTGANTVAITYSQAVNSTLGCVTFAGVDQTTPDGTSAKNSDTDGNVSASITIPADGAGASFTVYNEDPGACSNSISSQDERFEICNADFDVQGTGSTTTGTGTVAMEVTFAAANPGAIVAVPVNPVAVAPTSAVKRRMSVQ